MRGLSLSMAVSKSADAPVIIEVLAPSLVGTGLPRVVREARRPHVPGPWDVGSDGAYRLMRFLDRLREEFGTGVVVHVIEPLSFAWMLRVLRHRPRRYPAFIVGGREVVSGGDEHVVARIASLLRARPAGM